MAAHRSEVLANSLDLFAIVVPRAVEAELLAAPRLHPRREYHYAALFHYLRPALKDPPVPGPEPVPLFGAGEAEAIALAVALRTPLLINEWRAGRYAGGLGVQVVTVPAVVVALRALDVISERAARRKLELLRPITSAGLLERASLALDALQT